MLIASIAIIVGFVVLTWAADRFVAGAAAAARGMGVSPLLIGLTVVAIGTSSPEILVSANAAMQGNPGLGIGNALGSNIANFGLVLGAAALFAPLMLRSRTLVREFPMLLALMIISFLMLLDGELTRINGMVLCIGAVPLIWWMVHVGRNAKDDPLIMDTAANLPETMPMAKAITWLCVGLVLLLAGSQAVVWGGVTIAKAFGVSETVIGLSIIAIGTSLPELAASVVGAVKGEHDIAVGNVLGSNMFNLLVVLGLPGVIAPGTFDAEVLTRDYPMMLGLALLFFAVAYGRQGTPRVGRFTGVVMVTAFCVYLVILYTGT